MHLLKISGLREPPGWLEGQDQELSRNRGRQCTKSFVEWASEDTIAAHPPLWSAWLLVLNLDISGNIIAIREELSSTSYLSVISSCS